MDSPEGTRRYDVVVAGGGAAGLSAALTLGRARRSVLVVDAGEPRNGPADGVHNYLGQEGVPPGELLARGRREMAGYGGELAEGTVAAARREEDGGFRVELSDGRSVLARRLLVTTGLADELPDVPGLAQRWGREVLHCPYCHGWEVRDQPIGVLATGPMGVEQALLWRQWSEHVTLFLHTAPEPDDDACERLAARGIALADGRVEGLRVEEDRLTGVVLAGGRAVAVRALVVAPLSTVRAGVLTGLGLETAEMEMKGHVLGTYVPVDPSGATAVPGVWAAGNVANVAETVIGSANAGTRAAAAMNADLVAEDTRRAVDARRAPFSAAMERESCERVLGDRRHGL
ncbi:NAD(P)/FAD-dependent oxidoreductase [Actinomadura rubrisoli]|uniref:NAD(P)/FAD-dependent oxidoreductase n=2 Tax=Actinomadura rubrisoli TaxID=2530368 RepID=A0A4V2YY19_9ACTN|nr:NAD(P)/FAD-dependent oxidoreductase [Actinomadura rubrisoli]